MGKERMYYEELGYDFDPPFYRAKDKHVATNADRIRAMTDEELVEFFCDMIQDCGCNNVPCQKFCATKKTCEQAWLDWLKQEAGNG